MGLLADDKINGDSCEWCGVYFKRAHGHPVVCNSCWENASPELRKLVVRAYIKEIG